MALALCHTHTLKHTQAIIEREIRSPDFISKLTSDLLRPSGKRNIFTLTSMHRNHFFRLYVHLLFDFLNICCNTGLYLHSSLTEAVTQPMTRMINPLCIMEKQNSNDVKSETVESRTGLL